MKHLFFLIPGLIFWLATPAAAEVETPVIVELYTSQSCSSCPPADRLLSALAEKGGLITLSCHVTYWNHLNWKDTLSSEECTSRQRDFGRKLGAGQVYTPEAIINGRAAMVGHDGNAIRSAIRKERGEAKTKSLAITKSGDFYTAAFPPLTAGSQITYIVTLMVYGDEQTVKIGSGENGGESVTYSHPVIKLKRLDDWNGAAQNIAIARSDIPSGARGLVVTAQPGPGAPVAAVGELKL